jgi:hypothetical protein
MAELPDDDTRTDLVERVGLGPKISPNKPTPVLDELLGPQQPVDYSGEEF